MQNDYLEFLEKKRIVHKHSGFEVVTIYKFEHENHIRKNRCQNLAMQHSSTQLY